MPPIILASKSPRRREFLLKLGMKFEVSAPPAAEEKRNDGETPADYALRLAYNKADVVARGRPPGALVLAADTIVVLDDVIYGQPKDNDDARRMLKALSGRTHEVLTAVCVAKAGAEPAPQPTVISSKVSLRALTDQEIEWYLALGEFKDKAGAYAIQGAGGAFVTRIDGSYSNVVGLPLVETLELLKRDGALLPWEEMRQKYP